MSISIKTKQTIGVIFCESIIVTGKLLIMFIIVNSKYMVWLNILVSYRPNKPKDDLMLFSCNKPDDIGNTGMVWSFS